MIRSGLMKPQRRQKNQFEDADDYQGAPELIRLLADIVSKNGNLLLNVGPCADGSLHPAQVAALEGIGSWLGVNGAAIYGTRPWQRYGDCAPDGGEVRYTTKNGALYAIVVQLPAQGKLQLPPDVPPEATLLANGERLPVERVEQGIAVKLPDDLRADSIPVIRFRSSISS
ncbi:MAG: alpha-L-fucosidase [Anaerolineales bacterium]|nr:alpha-L-fucosidase [Anaerolineales bacterium]